MTAQPQECHVDMQLQPRPYCASRRCTPFLAAMAGAACLCRRAAPSTRPRPGLLRARRRSLPTRALPPQLGAGAKRTLKLKTESYNFGDSGNGNHAEGLPLRASPGHAWSAGRRSTLNNPAASQHQLNSSITPAFVKGHTRRVRQL